MSARATMRRGQAHNIDEDVLDEALAPLLTALDLDAADVLTLHVGTRYLSVQLVARDPRGKVVPGVSTRLRFPVVRA